ncbi:hypothetical protein FRB99_004223 [Tulasnella sp. 403]|nr:hypothetical protein FRB99_004223 [Tulasnella sp. 403]
MSNPNPSLHPFQDINSNSISAIPFNFFGDDTAVNVMPTPSITPPIANGMNIMAEQAHPMEAPAPHPATAALNPSVAQQALRTEQCPTPSTQDTTLMIMASHANTVMTAFIEEARQTCAFMQEVVSKIGSRDPTYSIISTPGSLPHSHNKILQE